MTTTPRTRHVNLRLPSDLAAALTAEADARGTTLTAIAVERLRQPFPEKVHTRPTQPSPAVDGDRVLVLDDDLYTIARGVAQRMEAVPLLQQLGVKITTAQAVRLALSAYSPQDPASAPPRAPPRPSAPPVEPERIVPELEARKITEASADFSDKTPDVPINPRPAPPERYAPNARWTAASHLPDELAALQPAHREYLARGWSLWSLAQVNGQVSWFYWTPDPAAQQASPQRGSGSLYLQPYAAGSSGIVHLVTVEAAE